MAYEAETRADGPHEAPARSYSAFSVASAAIGGIIVAFLLSWIYGPAEHYSPLIYLNLALAYGMAWTIGAAVRALLRKKRINRVLPAVIAGLAAGLAGWWFSWLAYIWVLTGYDFQMYIEYLTHPQHIYDAMAYLARAPMWTLGKSRANDPVFFYYIAWLLEAGVIILPPAYMARKFVAENLLCGHCNDWTRETGDSALFDPAEADTVAIAASLKQGDLSALLALPRLAPDAEAEQWIEATGSACPNCQDRDSYVSAVYATLKKGKKKKPEVIRIPLARHIQVGVEAERALFEPAEKLREEAAARAAQPESAPAAEHVR